MTNDSLYISNSGRFLTWKPAAIAYVYQNLVQTEQNLQTTVNTREAHEGQRKETC